METVASLAVLSSVMVGLAAMGSTASDDARTSQAAAQLMTVSISTNYYVRDNRTSIAAAATATKPFRISVADLIAAGHLPPGTSDTNAYGQKLCGLVFQPSPGVLNVMTVGEGEPLDDTTLGLMSASMGGGGGGVFAKDPTKIRGAAGTWEVPAATYHDRINVGPGGASSRNCAGVAGTVDIDTGTPVVATWYNEDTLGKYLSRVDTGDPEDTTMRTRLKLGQNTLGDLIVVPAATAGAACTAAQNGKPGYGTNNSFECQFNGGSYKWMAVTHCGTGNAVGDLASSSSGELMMCKQQGASTLWKRSSGFWQEPVENWAALNVLTCNASTRGETRVVQDAADGANRPRAYTCNGTNWMALALDNNGDLSLVRHVTTSGNLTANGTVSAAGNVTTNSNLIAAGGVQIGAGQTISSPGGMHIEAQENLYLKPWAGAGEVIVGGGGGNGRLTANGRVTANEYIQVQGIATENTWCPQNGLVGRSVSGVLLSCQSNTWKRAQDSAPPALSCYVQSVGGCFSQAVTASCAAGYTKVAWDTSGKDPGNVGGHVVGLQCSSQLFCCKIQ